MRAAANTYANKTMRVLVENGDEDSYVTAASLKAWKAEVRGESESIYFADATLLVSADERSRRRLVLA